MGDALGTVLPFRAEGRDRPTDERAQSADCEIVIFPGVRIERDRAAGPDEYHPAPGNKLDGTNGRRRPRKTS